MFNYKITIPLRSQLQRQALAEFTSVYLTARNPDKVAKFLGVPVSNLDCVVEKVERYSACIVTFECETLVQIGCLRQMLKGLFTLDMEIKWCGIGSSGILQSAIGKGIVYECIITPEPKYAGLEACLI